MQSDSQKLSVAEKVGYSLGDAGTNFVFQTQIMFLMFFYTDVFGIPAAAVGTLFLITRLWDAVNDPLMGAVADRTNTRWGKFRPWVLWTAVPFGVVFALTFTTPHLDMEGKLLWAYVTYILLMMIYTANNIPYSAMTGVLTGDSIERTSLASYRFIFVIVAALVIQGFVRDMVDVLGKENGSVVQASLSDSSLTLQLVDAGTAKVAVTAHDSSGHSVTKSFIVRVVAEAAEIPVLESHLDDLELRQGFDRNGIDLSGVFHEGIHGPLTFSVEVQKEGIVSCHVDGGTLVIEEVGSGVTDVVIDAEDRYGSKVREQFSVVVRSLGNSTPRATKQPDVRLRADFGSTRISLDDLFVDKDGDTLTYSVHGTDRAVVTTAIDHSELVLSESGPGLTRLKLTADDGRGGVASLTIPVMVETGANLAPALLAPLEAVTKRIGSGALDLDLSHVFADPDGDELRYSVEVIDQAKGFQRTILIFAVLAVIFFFVTFFTTTERVQPDPTRRASIRQDLFDLLHNGPWIALFALTIFIFVNLAMRGAITLYYFRYYIGREELFGLFNGVGLGTAMFGILLSKPLAARFGKRNVFRVLLSFTALFLFLFLFVPPNAIWAVFLLQVLLQLSYGPTVPLLWAMMADVADYSEWRTGRRATGMTFSAASFGSKVGLGLGGAASGWLLAQYGYVPNVEQSDATRSGILLMMSVFPAAAFFVGVVVLFWYRIDKPMMLRIQEELTERRKQYQDSTSN